MSKSCIVCFDSMSKTFLWQCDGTGDDPKDVKARLKVWAQAVALASSSGSSSRYGGT